MNRPMEQVFLLALKEAGIPSCQFIDTWANYADRFVFKGDDGKPRLEYPDHILTLDSQA